MKTKKKFLGETAVDSGCVVITDPCYTAEGRIDTLWREQIGEPQGGTLVNEFDPFAAQWLRNLIAAGHIAPGDVDERERVERIGCVGRTVERGGLRRR